jgi:hypothetical protein
MTSAGSRRSDGMRLATGMTTVAAASASFPTRATGLGVTLTWMVVACCFLAVATAYRRFAVDDAFITLRYVGNLLNGKGWVYNPGEHVNALTSPAHALLLAGVSWIIGEQADPSLVSATLIGICAVAAGVALHSKPSWRSGVTALSIVGMPIIWLTLGMEAPLQALSTIAVGSALSHACLKRDAVHTGLLLGLLVGVAAGARPEGALLLPMTVAVLLCVRRPSAATSAASVFALLASAWALFAWKTFGSILPSTLAAKQAQANVGIWSHSEPFLLEVLRVVPAWPIVLVLAALGGRDAWCALSRPEPATRRAAITLLLIASFGVVQCVSYTMLQPAIYGWYCVPLALGLNLAAARGCTAAWSGPPRAWLRFFVIAGAIVAMAWSTRRLWRHPKSYRLSSEYAQAGVWLRNHAAPHDAVAAAEIGYLGFESRRRIIDVYALIHPESIAAWAANPMWWEQRRPRWIIYHLPTWLGEPSSEDAVRGGCLEQHRIKVDAVANEQIVISQCTWPF